MVMGILLGLYLGIWVMFIGGIVQLIESIKSVPVSALGIACGIARIVFCAVVGWASFFLVSGMGGIIAGVINNE